MDERKIKGLRVRLGPIGAPGFPARSITRQISGQSGEWITAYQVEQSRHLKAVLKYSDLGGGQSSKVIHPPSNTREVSSRPRQILNKKFLLEHCFVVHPSDLSEANISGNELIDYKYEELKEFNELILIKASDNHLPLEAFRSFPCIQILELSLNSIMDVSIEQGDFLKLKNLDLSYNNLSDTALLTLGTLPSLKELKLTGNNLVALPVEMSVPYLVEGSEQVKPRFSLLEKLWLDDNKLSDQATFATLAGLRKLKYLNLNDNELYTIPHLKLLGTSPLIKPPPSTTQSSGTNGDSSNIELPNTCFSPRYELEHHLPTNKNKNTADLPMNNKNTAEKYGRGRCVGRLLATSAPNTPRCHATQEAKELTQISSGTLSSSAPNTPRFSIAQRNATLSPTNQINSVPGSPNQKTVLINSRKLDEKEPTQFFDPPNQRDTNIVKPDSSQSHTSNISNDSVPIDVGSSTDPVAKITLDNAEKGGDRRKSSENTVMVEPLNSTPGLIPLNFDLAPFPVLETLKIVNNLILSPEGLLACLSWPALKQIHIYDNPLTKTSKGMPPLIQEYLVNQLGIDVIRKRPKLLKSTSHIRKAAKDFKKISTALPPIIPRQPLPAIEAPPTSYFPALDLPLSSTSHQQSLTSGSESGESSESTGIFITQVSGEESSQSSLPVEEQTSEQNPERITEHPWSADQAFEAKLKEIENKYQHLPDRYSGYEALLDVKDDPNDSIPADIHGCSRALQYALKHPFVVPEYHVKTSHRLTTTSPRAKLQKNVGPSIKTSTKLLDLKKVLNEIRTHRHCTDTNLSEVLSPRAHKNVSHVQKLQKEGRKLLVEMQAHYDKIRAASLHFVTEDPPTATPTNNENTPSYRKHAVTFSESVT